MAKDKPGAAGHAGSVSAFLEDQNDQAARQGEPIAIGYKIPKDQTLHYKITPKGGGFLTAKSVGGQIEAIAKLLEAVAKKDEPDLKWLTCITAIYTEADGSVCFDLMIAPKNDLIPCSPSSTKGAP